MFRDLGKRFSRRISAELFTIYDWTSLQSRTKYVDTRFNFVHFSKYHQSYTSYYLPKRCFSHPPTPGSMLVLQSRGQLTNFDRNWALTNIQWGEGGCVNNFVRDCRPAKSPTLELNSRVSSVRGEIPRMEKHSGFLLKRLAKTADLQSKSNGNWRIWNGSDWCGIKRWHLSSWTTGNNAFSAGYSGMGMGV